MTMGLASVEAFVDGIDDKILWNLSSVRRNVREKATASLEASLWDVSSQIDLLCSIPLELSKRGELLSSLWCLEILIATNKPVKWEDVRSVLDISFQALTEFSRANDEDTVIAYQKRVTSLLKTLQKSWNFSDESEVILYAWKFEFWIWESEKALSYFNKAIESGLEDGYISSADVYQHTGDYTIALYILEAWWKFFRNPDFLEKTISIHCMMENLALAKKCYDQYSVALSGKVKPFLFYKWSVESDAELIYFSQMISRHDESSDFLYSQELHKLSISAGDYIAGEILKNKLALSDFVLGSGGIITDKGKIDLSSIDFTKVDFDVFSEIIRRGLFLIQTDVLTLCNTENLGEYITSIFAYSEIDDPRFIEMLDKYFEEYFSPVALQLKDSLSWDEEKFKEKYYGIKEWRRPSKSDSQKWQPSTSESDANNWGSDTPKDDFDYEIDDEDDEEIQPSSAYLTNTYYHLTAVLQLFSQTDCVKLHEHITIPAIRKLSNLLWNTDVDAIRDFDIAVSNLQNRRDFLLSYRLDVRAAYAGFCNHIDNTYGPQYRRRIQKKSTAPDSNTYEDDFDADIYPNYLRQNPELAVFFWITKIINGDVNFYSEEKLESMISSFKLDRIDVSHAVVFNSFLSKLFPLASTSYILSIPDVLDAPMLLLELFESMRCITEENRELLLNDLDELAVNNYEASSFLEHVEYTAKTILHDSEDATRDDRSMALLLRGMILSDFGKDDVAAIENYNAALTVGNPIANCYIADSLENIGKFEEALTQYESYFDDVPDTFSLYSILRLSLQIGKYDIAKHYLDRGIEQGFNVSEYLLIFYLRQWEVESALLVAINNFRKGQWLSDIIPGTVELFSNTLSFVLSSPNTPTGNERLLKCYSTYLSVNVAASDPDKYVLSEMIVQHWNFIKAFCDSKSDETLCSEVIWLFSKFADTPFTESSWKLLETEAYTLLHAYASESYQLLRKEFSKTLIVKEAYDLSARVSALQHIVASILRRIPGADMVVEEWMNTDALVLDRPSHAIHPAPTIIQ